MIAGVPGDRSVLDRGPGGPVLGGAKGRTVAEVKVLVKTQADYRLHLGGFSFKPPAQFANFWRWIFLKFRRNIVQGWRRKFTHRNKFRQGRKKLLKTKAEDCLSNTE